jgi:hypothetical protein
MLKSIPLSTRLNLIHSEIDRVIDPSMFLTFKRKKFPGFKMEIHNRSKTTPRLSYNLGCYNPNGYCFLDLTLNPQCCVLIFSKSSSYFSFYCCNGRTDYKEVPWYRLFSTILPKIQSMYRLISVVLVFHPRKRFILGGLWKHNSKRNSHIAWQIWNPEANKIETFSSLLVVDDEQA